MNKTFTFKTSLLIAAIMAMSAANAQTISKAEYATGKTRISDMYSADKKACASLSGNGKDVCMEEAKGKEKVAKAELEYAHSAKPADQKKLADAKADATYNVAKEKCDDLAGNPKSVCVTEAKAAHTKALTDAKTGAKIADAKMDGADAKRDADYKVAVEKCDALAGDAKSNCIATAKAQFKKS